MMDFNFIDSLRDDDISEFYENHIKIGACDCFTVYGNSSNRCKDNGGFGFPGHQYNVYEVMSNGCPSYADCVYRCQATCGTNGLAGCYSYTFGFYSRGVYNYCVRI